MRFSTIAFAALMFTSLLSYAQNEDYYTSQDFQVSLSNPFPVIDASTKLYLNSDNFIVALKMTRKGYIIQTFDAKDQKELARREYQGMERNENFEYFSEVDGRFYFFFTRTDKDKEEENLIVKEIDPKTAKFIGAEKNIIKVNGLFKNNSKGAFMTISIGKNRIFGRFSFKRSGDRKNLLIYYHAGLGEKRDKDQKERVGVYIFDAGLKQLWTKTIDMNYSMEEMDITNFAVDKASNVYILTKIFLDGNKDQKKRKDEKVNYTMELLTLSNYSEQVEYRSIDMDDNKFLKSAILYERMDGQMVIAGYYRNAVSTAVDGVFIIDIDKDGSVEREYYPIPVEILNQYESKKQVRRNEKNEEDDEAGSQFLVLDKMYVDDAGNLMLIGEEYMVRSTTRTSSNGSVQTTYTYYYMDMLVTRINANGQLAWMRKIPKMQKGASNPGGMSFATLHNGKELYLLYLDNVNNFEIKKDETPKIHLDGKGGFLTSARIDYETGEVTKQHLFDLRNVEGVEVYQFATSRIINLSADEIAVEVYKKKKEDVWIKVALK